MSAVYFSFAFGGSFGPSIASNSGTRNPRNLPPNVRYVRYNAELVSAQ